MSVPASSGDLASGKGHKDENFPVASALLKREYRAPILAFYRFARAADDVADNAAAAPQDKLAMLGAMRASIRGDSDADAASVALRETMRARGLSPQHALDLLVAFERDCTVDACADWGALIEYCRYSAMPVGRYVLDVHGESAATWPASDALCAALQVINHLQDCGKDARAIGRSYIPLDILERHGATLSDLLAPAAGPELLAAIRDCAVRTDALLAEAAGFASSIRDRRLGVEVAIIHALAVDLNARLEVRDPLSQRVHHSKAEALARVALAAARQVVKGRA